MKPDETGPDEIGLDEKRNMNPRLRSAFVAATIVILDRLTKIAILDTFPPRELIPIIPGSSTSFTRKILEPRSACWPRLRL